MSVTLTIELASLSEAGVITDALRREIESVANSLRYSETQAAEPFSQKGIAVEEREAARAKHEAARKRHVGYVAEYKARLALAEAVWSRVSS